MKRILIVSGGWEGHSPQQMSQFFTGLLRERGFEVEQRDSLEIFADLPTLKTFDLIIPNWTMGTLTGDQEWRLAEAVASGVGLGGWHGGMGDAFRSNTTYQFMTGGQFVAHPDNEKDYTVHIVKSSDPIMKGLSDFQVRSEQYFMHIDPSNEVLATTTFETKEAPQINGTVIPVVWKRRWGTGKVFYSSLGHNVELFHQTPEAKEIQLRGLEWACR